MSDFLSPGQAVWWLRLTGTAVHLQHERVRESQANGLTDDLFVDCWQLAAATYRFGMTLKRSRLESAYQPFRTKIGGLEKFRHVCEHADEWLRGRGGLGKNATGQLDGFEVLLPSSSNPRRDLLLFQLMSEDVANSDFYMPLAMWPATREALEIAAAELVGGHQLRDLLTCDCHVNT